MKKKIILCTMFFLFTCVSLISETEIIKNEQLSETSFEIASENYSLWYWVGDDLTVQVREEKNGGYVLFRIVDDYFYYEDYNTLSFESKKFLEQVSKKVLFLLEQENGFGLGLQYLVENLFSSSYVDEETGINYDMVISMSIAEKGASVFPFYKINYISNEK